MKRFVLERHGRSGKPVMQGKSLTNRVNLPISNRFAWCKGHRVGRRDRYTRCDLRAEDRGGGTCVRVRRAPKSHLHRFLTWICVETKVGPDEV